VKLTEMAREPLGLTFVGRGFDVRIATPFNKTIEDGLRTVAEECVRYCPTGALEFRDEAIHRNGNGQPAGARATQNPEPTPATTPGDSPH
jgi:hypothetical protein